jgi:hypothetical protein
MALLVPKVLGPNTGYLALDAQLAAATAGGDSFALTGREILVVSNQSGVSVTVTLSTVVANVADNFGVVNAVHDLVFVILTLGRLICGPFTVGRFRDVNGNAQITYSAVVTVTVGVFTVGTTG